MCVCVSITKISSYIYIYIYIYIVITLPHLTHTHNLVSCLSAHHSHTLTHNLTVAVALKRLKLNSSFHSHSQVSTQVIKPHAIDVSPPSSDQENPRTSLATIKHQAPRRQAQPQSSIKHHENLHNPRELPLTRYRPTTGWIWVFFLFVFL